MPSALRLIITYKTAKGFVQLGLAVIIVASIVLGLTNHLASFGDVLRHRVTHAWAEHVATWCTREATRGHLLVVSLALALDGALSLFEGWALHHRHWWGPWVVVVASGALIPFEIVELFVHPHVTRALLVVANAAIVFYLVSHAKRLRREMNATVKP